MSTTTEEKMWNDDREVCKDHTVPPWIEQDIHYDHVMAILQGGCDSGAYMPSVTYHIASDVMSAHGDAVLAYLDDYGITDEVSLYKTGDSWSMIAVRALSLAVETWASRIYDAYEDQDLSLDDELDRLAQEEWTEQGVTEG